MPLHDSSSLTALSLANARRAATSGGRRILIDGMPLTGAGSDAQDWMRRPAPSKRSPGSEPSNGGLQSLEIAVFKIRHIIEMMHERNFDVDDRG